MRRYPRIVIDDEGWEIPMQLGSASADLVGVGLDPAEQIALAEELTEMESKRIRPGFYVGLDYKVAREDDEEEVEEPESQVDHYELVDAMRDAA